MDNEYEFISNILSSDPEQCRTYAIGLRRQLGGQAGCQRRIKKQNKTKNSQYCKYTNAENDLDIQDFLDAFRNQTFIVPEGGEMCVVRIRH